MVAQRGPLGLNIPEQINPTGQSFLADPKKVSQWIEGLPRAHVGETTRQIFLGAKELNRLQLPPDRRFEVLELFHEPAAYVIASLKKYYLEQGFPLSSKSLKVASLVSETLAEITCGYKIVLEHALSTSLTSSRNRTVMASLFRAVQHSNEILLNSYQIYADHPANLWLELHRLYQYAAHNNIHRLAVSGIKIAPIYPETIDGLYKQALLLSLANPYQLPQRDIAAIYENLPAWTPYCSLVPLSNLESPPGLYAVNLNSDEPPRYFESYQAVHTECLGLDTTNLANHVRDMITGNSGQAHPYPVDNAVRSLSYDTLRRLFLSWGLLAKRSFRRHGSRGETQVTLGLPAIYRFLTKQQGTPDKLRASTERKQATFTSQSVVSADGSGAYPDMWDMEAEFASTLKREKDGSFTRSRGQEKLGVASAAKDESRTFNIANESAGGYCLLWKNTGKGYLKVGDLVCVHQPADVPNGYTICIVRWLKNIETTMVLGVEVIAPQAEAIVAQLGGTPEGRSVEFTAALLVPSIERINRPATLLTSTQYQAGDIINIDGANKSYRVYLTHLQQSTHSFKQFQFVAEEQARTTESDDSFDSLWSSL